MTFMLVLAVVAGGFCIFAGFREVGKQRRLVREGVPVTGWVYRMDRKRDSDGTSYTPVIAFRDENGIEHKFRLTLSEGTVKHPVGSQVPLRYVPGRPDLVDLDTRRYKFLSLLLPFGIGTVFIAVAVWSFLR